MITARSISRGGGYASNHLQYSDYIDEQAQVKGFWAGRGADWLGLAGIVQNEQLEAVRQGLHPSTGEKLRPMIVQGSNARTYYDFTISAPKSVSIQAIVGEDRRIFGAHDQAVRVALCRLELYAETRVRRSGANENRKTENLIIAAFTHDTSRSLDPQIHTHCVAVNMTFDPVEKRWKALQARSIYDHLDLLTECYRWELASRLIALGYGIENIRNEHGRDLGFEIAGISKEIRDAYSQRSKDRDRAIEEFIVEEGRRPSKREVAVLVRNTREGKLREIATEEVRRLQRERVGSVAVEQLRELRNRAITRGPVPQTESPVRAFQLATEHVFERMTVVRQQDLILEGLRFGRGRIGEKALLEELAAEVSRGNLLKLGDQLTTKEALTREGQMIDYVNAGIGGYRAIGATPIPGAGALLREIRFAVKPEQSAEQSGALRGILASRDRVLALQGAAGTGKTTVLQEVAAAVELSGRRLACVAPTASAARVLEGQGLGKSATVQFYLQSEFMQRSLAQQVLVVDEAGMIGSRTMKDLLAITEQHQTRVLLVGDPKQLQSVDAGDALRTLIKDSKLQVFDLREVFRQKGQYREAITALRNDPSLGFDVLERMGAVSEVERDQRAELVAEKYLALRDVPTQKGAKRETLIVAPTWKEAEEVNDAIRRNLKQQGVLEGEKNVVRLTPLNWTEAERKDLTQYKGGEHLVFHKATRHFGKHQSGVVVGLKDKKLEVRRNDGKLRSISIKQAKCFGVYKADSLGVAVGDRLLLHENRSGRRSRTLQEKAENLLVRVVDRDALFRATNGELVTVSGFDGRGRIELTDGRKMPVNYQQFSHGYAVTVHASQGKTVDSVIVTGDRMSHSHFYVAASRGKETVDIVTSNRTSLRNSVAVASKRKSAIELAKEAKAEQQRALQAKRSQEAQQREAERRQRQPKQQANARVR